jgi:hypothetical protein
MTYNRQKYINNNFDHNNVEEIKIYQKIMSENLSGLKYNLFIKDYIIERIREDIMGIDFTKHPVLSELVYKFLPLLQLGMFNTIRQLISSVSITDPNLSGIILKWDEILKEANDID